MNALPYTTLFRSRDAALILIHAGELPAADQDVERTREVARESPSPSEWHFEDAVDGEAMRNVFAGDAFPGLGVAAVQELDRKSTSLNCSHRVNSSGL